MRLPTFVKLTYFYLPYNIKQSEVIHYFKQPNVQKNAYNLNASSHLSIQIRQAENANSCCFRLIFKYNNTILQYLLKISISLNSKMLSLIFLAHTSKLVKINKLLLSHIIFIIQIKTNMRVSCPPSSSPSTLFKNPVPPSQLYPPPLEPQKHSITSSLQVWRQHTQHLSQLYQRSKFRNQRLLQLGVHLSCHISFLKEYCATLERELDQRGFYNKKEYDALSRRETAATIFQSYDETCSELTSLSSSQGLEEELARLQNRNLNLQIQNKQLHSQIKAEAFLKVHQAVQVALLDQEKLRKECKQSEVKIGKLTQEVDQLKRANGELERQRRRTQHEKLNQNSDNVFSNIHCLISEYRKKLEELSKQKKEIQRRYVSLRQRISLIETGKQLKVMQMLAEKIDLLQKFAQKQQAQIQRTIDLYESELAKIEKKSKIEQEYFQNQKINLQSENLQLCIDLQRTLNRNDSVNLQLLQQKNKTQILRKEIANMAHDVALLEAKDIAYKCQKLKIDSSVVKFYGQDFYSAQKLMQSHIKLSCHSAGYKPYDQNSNTSNYEYQYSEMQEHSPILRKVEVVYPHAQRMSKALEKQDRVSHQSAKIIPPYFPLNPVEYIRHPLPDKLQHSNSNPRVWDSAVEYKRKFVERKPDSSFKR